MESAADILVDWISQFPLNSETPKLIFVSGSQGIGKSTAMTSVEARFADDVAILSLDDFYLTQQDRMQIAKSISPLFDTRGPAGTHDLALLNNVLDQLTKPGGAQNLSSPVFNKRIDDRVPQNEWRPLPSSPKLIILEGWLIGAEPDPLSPTSAPLNTVETKDADGSWRGYQEDQLAGPYSELWNRADAFFHLEAPNFETVLGWRLQQEAGNFGVTLDSLPQERKDWVTNFILYYERLTRRMLDGMKRPGARVRVDENRRPVSYAPD